MNKRRSLTAAPTASIRQALLQALFAAAFVLMPGFSASARAASAPDKIVIADQFGPGHLVTVVMKQRGLLQRRFPNVTFEWRVVTSGAVIRDGMMTDLIHIGITAPPPFMIGRDKGLKWKIIAGAATYDQWLVTTDSAISSLKDFKAGARKQIAVVGLDSFPAIVLKKAAQQEWGDAKALDSYMVIMSPAQAIPSMLAGQLAAALIPPVACVRAVEGGARVVLRANDVFSGPVTNNFYVMMESFYQLYPEFAQGFHDAVNEAIRFIKESPDEAFKMLSDDEGGKTSPEKYKDLMGRSGTEFSATPVRVLEVAKFMQDIGMITNLPKSMQEISFPPASK